MPRDGGSQRRGPGRRRFVRTLAAAGAVGLAGCTRGADDDTFDVDGTSTPADPSAAKTGGELVTTLSADVTTTDPVEINDSPSGKVTSGLIYESLLANDFDGRPRPVLAESVERDGSDTTWKITLREGVTFHDGSDLTAEDVKATFERYEGSLRESDVYLWYGGSEITGEYELRLRLSRPYAPLKVSALPNVPIVPAEAADGGIDLATDPVGTGPYELVSNGSDSPITLERNEEYWYDGGGGNVPATPPIRRLTFRVVEESSNQEAALKAGDVDLITAPPAKSLLDLDRDDRFTVTARHAGSFDMLIFPTGSKPFDSALVRRGVTRLVPRERILDAVYDGVGRPAYTPVAPLARQFTDDGETVTFADEGFQREMRDEYVGFDRGKATDLLERGFEEAGVSKPFSTTLIANQNDQRVRWCQLVKETLEESGYFEVNVDTFDWGTYHDRIRNENAHRRNELAALGWTGGWDPDNYVHYILSSDAFGPSCCNYAHYHNPKVDRLIAEGLNTYDVRERRRIYREIQREVARDSPMAFVRFDVQANAFATDRVKGFATNPIDGFEFKAIYAPYADRFTYVER